MAEERTISISTVMGDLWDAEQKVVGIGVLFRNLNRDGSINPEELSGVGYILIEIGKKIQTSCRELDEISLNVGKTETALKEKKTVD